MKCGIPNCKVNGGTWSCIGQGCQWIESNYFNPDKMKYFRDKQWFLDRIGKRIFRGPVSCTCETCTKVHHEGLIIHDKDQADYLFDVQNEIGIKYFDKPQEA